MSGVHNGDEETTGARSGHSAILHGGAAWELSWLREHTLARAAALAGVQLAEEIAAGVHPGTPGWSYVEQLAAAVGLPADVAARRVETYAADAPARWT